MSFTLVEEVKVFLRTGPDLAPTDRLLLLCLAVKAHEHDRIGGPDRLVPARTCSPSTEELRTLLGVGEEGLRRSLQRLALAGLEVRVSVGTDSGGREIYARRGRQRQYRLPELPSGEDHCGEDHGHGRG